VETGRLDLRVFLRDQNSDLMDRYLNRGIYRSIPVFAFFDENMNEIARFIERPPKVTEVIEKKMLEVRRALRSEHLEEWRQAVVDEVRDLLEV
ncbi:MAG: thioredoxin family protein, partial [Candidatus Rokubacteria bacterium]|nr:thioredoxin family protein [Candidatus Rokubacteria bacterium]